MKAAKHKSYSNNGINNPAKSNNSTGGTGNTADKGGILSEIGNLSDNAISLISALAMGVLLIAPGIMAEMAMFKRSIDFTMNIYLSMIKHLVFPLACSIVFVVYFIVCMRIHLRGVSIKKIIARNPVFFIFFLASFLILASQFYNGAQYALTGFCAQSLGETFGMEICYFVFILFGATQIKAESHKRILCRIQIIISVILVIASFVLWHTQIESTFFSDWTPRFSSIFSNTNYYGYYLSVSVPVAGAAFIYEKSYLWKAVAGVSFIINTISLSLNNTMGAWLGAIFAIIFIIVAHLIIEKKVNWQALVLIPVFALSLYIPGHINGTFESNFSTLTGDVSSIMSGAENAADAGSGRWRIWSASMDIVKEHSLVGIGFEGVKQRAYVGPPYNIRPHNEFIQYAMFHGIPMVIVYFIGCLGIFIRALRKKKILNGATLVCLAGAFGYLVSSFFGMTLFSTGYFLFVFLGMGYVNDYTLESPNREQAASNRSQNAFLVLTTFVSAVLLIIIFGVKGLSDSESAATNSGNVATGTATNQNGEVKSVPISVNANTFYYIDDDFAVAGGFASAEVDMHEVNIPNIVEYQGKQYPVAIVYESAFKGADALTRVVISSSVKLIEENAFASCSNLTEVSLEEGLEGIADGAFYGCSSLQSIRIPSTVQNIGVSVFDNCDKLNTVYVHPDQLSKYQELFAEKNFKVAAY